jgi:hypothetical protein
MAGTSRLSRAGLEQVVDGARGVVGSPRSRLRAGWPGSGYAGAVLGGAHPLIAGNGVDAVRFLRSVGALPHFLEGSLGARQGWLDGSQPAGTTRLGKAAGGAGAPSGGAAGVVAKAASEGAAGSAGGAVPTAATAAMAPTATAAKAATATLMEVATTRASATPGRSGAEAGALGVDPFAQMGGGDEALAPESDSSPGPEAGSPSIREESDKNETSSSGQSPESTPEESSVAGGTRRQSGEAGEEQGEEVAVADTGREPSAVELAKADDTAAQVKAEAEALLALAQHESELAARLAAKQERLFHGHQQHAAQLMRQALRLVAQAQAEAELALKLQGGQEQRDRVHEHLAAQLTGEAAKLMAAAQREAELAAQLEGRQERNAELHRKLAAELMGEAARLIAAARGEGLSDGSSGSTSEVAAAPSPSAAEVERRRAEARRRATKRKAQREKRAAGAERARLQAIHEAAKAQEWAQQQRHIRDLHDSSARADEGAVRARHALVLRNAEGAKEVAALETHLLEARVAAMERAEAKLPASAATGAGGHDAVAAVHKRADEAERTAMRAVELAADRERAELERQHRADEDLRERCARAVEGAMQARLELVQRNALGARGAAARKNHLLAARVAEMEHEQRQARPLDHHTQQEQWPRSPVESYWDGKSSLRGLVYTPSGELCVYDGDERGIRPVLPERIARKLRARDLELKKQRLEQRKARFPGETTSHAEQEPGSELVLTLSTIP